MIKSIKRCLSNEEGGPNLDSILAMATGFMLIVGVWAIGRALYYYFYETPAVSAVDKEQANEQTVVVGFRK